MASITANIVKTLRERTGAGIMDCRNALIESNGNEDSAVVILKKKGLVKATKKAIYSTYEGIVESYIHGGGKIGVLLELNCESIFVAKNEQFKSLAHDLCMHIAAKEPLAVSRENIPASLVAKVRKIAVAKSNLETVVENSINRFFSDVTLLEQTFIKIPDQTIKDLLVDAINKMGENIKIRRFVRYSIQ